MTLKAKIKFKECVIDRDNDVIVIKVKRNNWDEFSKLLGAALESAYNGWGISESAARVIENKFDAVKFENQ